MIWYNGFLGVDIERLGVKLNHVEDEKDLNIKNKDMTHLIKVKLYEMTPNEMVMK